jgi:hypothetical protein
MSENVNVSSEAQVVIPAVISEESERRIVDALERYSPFGLCDGVLIRANGERSKTVGCAVGCLIAAYHEDNVSEAARWDEWVRGWAEGTYGEAKRTVKNLVGWLLYNSQSQATGVIRSDAGRNVSLNAQLACHYGVTEGQINAIMSFNDGVSVNTLVGNTECGAFEAMAENRQTYAIKNFGRRIGETVAKLRLKWIEGGRDLWMEQVNREAQERAARVGRPRRPTWT